MEGIFSSWGRILGGHAPSLSIEITRECPLRCPGCYAYGEDHLGGQTTLREVRDFKGQALIDGVHDLIDRHNPVHVSIVGGEPLVRYRELNQILPELARRDIHTQLVTSAVRPIPSEWIGLRRLQVVVSIDGLAPEHDVRRTPATYDRILKHIEGHQITVHCTVTRQQVRREGYIADFQVGDDASRPGRTLAITLKYAPDRTPTITGLRRVSKPGLRVYTKADKLPRVLGGLGVAVLSTSQGLMTDREAREKRVGGEILCYVW